MEENIPTPEPEAIGQLTDDVSELKAKSVSGFGWSTIQQIVGRVTTFVVNLALARLLVPEDFGTLAVLGIFLAISTQLADIGFGSSLTRSERVDDADLSTIFYYNIGMSSLLYLILFIAAPWIADYFRNPILVSVLRVISLSVVINSLYGIQGILVWRQMQFRKDMLIQLASGVLSGLTGVAMAYFGFGYWSLVGMGLANSIVRLIGYWCSSSWRPKLIFSMEKLKLHFGYGSRMVGAGMITTLYNNLMTILIGRYFSLSTLGLYGNANALYIIPVSVIADPINKVTFPVFVRFQNDKERLRAGYRRVMRLLFQLSCPLMMALVVLANPLYHFFYGDDGWRLHLTSRSSVSAGFFSPSTPIISISLRPRAAVICTSVWRLFGVSSGSLQPSSACSSVSTGYCGVRRSRRSSTSLSIAITRGDSLTIPSVSSSLSSSPLR